MTNTQTTVAARAAMRAGCRVQRGGAVRRRCGLGAECSVAVRCGGDAGWEQSVAWRARGAGAVQVCCTEHASESCHPSFSTDERQWLTAPIAAAQPSSLELSVSACGGGGRHVVGVRYAWRHTPCAPRQCALYTSSSSSSPPLPMSSFIRHGLVADAQWHSLAPQPLPLRS